MSGTRDDDAQTPQSGAVAMEESERPRYFPFPKGHTIELSVRERFGSPASGKEITRAQALYLSVDADVVHAAGYLYPGTQVQFPLETIDGERMTQTGEIASCKMIDARRHRVEIRFGMPLVPEYFVVCWGVPFGDEGPQGAVVEAQVESLREIMDRAGVDEELVALSDKLGEAIRDGAPDEEVRARAAAILAAVDRRSA